MIRWIGFVLIVSGASAAGILFAAKLKHTLELYRQTATALAFMKNEIEFQLTPIREIADKLSIILDKPLSSVFQSLIHEMRTCPAIPLGLQMERVLKQNGALLPAELRRIWTSLFDLLGKQDAIAQIRAIQLAEGQVEREMAHLSADRHERARAYRIAGVCTGLALAVILI